MAGIVVTAGSCIMRREPRPDGESIAFVWTSDASGDVKANIQESFNGLVYKLYTSPFNAPTANYDIELLNEYGGDALLGAGIDRSSTADEIAFIYESSNPEVVNYTSGKHRLRISGAGNAKSGTIVITLLNSQAGNQRPVAGEPIADGGGFESPGGFS
jgi:hypothetical protein